MKVLIINAGAGTDSNSSYIVERLCEKYSDAKTVHLRELDFDPSYPLKKDDTGFKPELVEEGLRDIMSAVVDSGFIIFVSPNYFSFISGTAKLFLDKFYVFLNKSGRPTFDRDKRFFFILTQASKNRGHGQGTQDWMKNFAGMFDMKYFGITVPGCVGSDPEAARVKMDEISMSLNMFV